MYNGLYIPPTLRVQPGDTMNITINNDFDNPTNLHHHGANVSPQNNSDNIFVEIQPGSPAYLQQVFYPSNHQPGMLWITLTWPIMWNRKYLLECRVP